MRVTISHDKGRAAAKRMVNKGMDHFLRPERYGPFMITGGTKNWNGALLDFTLSGQLGPIGVPISGTIKVGEREVAIDCRLPWLIERLTSQRKIQAAIEARFRALMSPGS